MNVNRAMCCMSLNQGKYRVRTIGFMLYQGRVIIRFLNPNGGVVITKDVEARLRGDLFKT